jgi:hypothetical protein
MARVVNAELLKDSRLKLCVVKPRNRYYPGQPRQLRDVGSDWNEFYL